MGMFDMLKKAQELQANMQKLQAELKETEIEGSAGGGLVNVVVSGAHAVKKITIKKDAVDPGDIATLEDLVTVAVNDAITKANALTEKKMSALTGGLKIPGLMG
ncbi:MAG TPA: YbaB/EbfC family nucleoid-associated protein [Alphaproteobacteria bacterium]|nr:YbaB/EbfC family nucleoid-associated protein [Alphaproteobacteria bacterium]